MMKLLLLTFPLLLLKSAANEDLNTANIPFTPGPSDGFLFHQMTNTNYIFFVESSDHLVQQVMCEIDDNCACVQTGCMGQQKLMTVKSKMENAKEVVRLTSNGWRDVSMGCPQSSQTPNLEDSSCFEDGSKNPMVTETVFNGPIIDSFNVVNSDGCKFITLEISCSGGMRRKTTSKEVIPLSRRAKDAKAPKTPSPTPASTIEDAVGRANASYNPAGKFFFLNRSSYKEIFVDGSKYKIETLTSQEGDEGWCNTQLCMGSYNGIVVEGEKMTGGDKVVLSVSDPRSLTMLCPFGYQTAHIESSSCVGGGSAGIVGVGDSGGPFIEFGIQNNCPSGDYAIVEIHCEDNGITGDSL